MRPLRRTVLHVLSAVVAPAVVLAIGFAAGPAAAQSYRITDLGTLGGNASDATSLNDLGQIVGASDTTSGDSHAFLYRGGVMWDIDLRTGRQSFANGINKLGHAVGKAGERAFLHNGIRMVDLGTLGGTSSEANDINDLGQVVGSAATAGDAAQHAFLRTSGRMKDLGTLGGTVSYANGINVSGRVVGGSFLSGDARQHAFIYDGAKMRDLGTLGGSNSYANGINAAGHVVGCAALAGDGEEHAFLYSVGVMRDLGTLGGTKSYANAINGLGHVVGGSLLAGDTVEHAFLYSGGVLYDLNDLIPPASGWVLHWARDMNQARQIVGAGSIGGEVHAFLLTPKVQIAALTVSPTSVRGGRVARGLIRLDGPAPPGGVFVTLTSSHPSLAFPLTTGATIPQGATRLAFSIVTGVVTASTPVTFTASYDGDTDNAVLTLRPN